MRPSYLRVPIFVLLLAAPVFNSGADVRLRSGNEGSLAGQVPRDFVEQPCGDHGPLWSPPRHPGLLNDDLLDLDQQDADVVDVLARTPGPPWARASRRPPTAPAMPPPRFFACAARDAGEDNRSLPSPVCVLETLLGRNAGWIVAAASFARRSEEDAPHLICFPERCQSLDRIAAGRGRSSPRSKRLRAGNACSRRSGFIRTATTSSPHSRNTLPS